MPTRWASTLTWLASLAVMLSLYAGAYYALVRPRLYFASFAPHYGKRLPVAWNKKEQWSARITPCFAPIHSLDRRLRPHVWEIATEIRIPRNRPRPFRL